MTAPSLEAASTGRTLSPRARAIIRRIGTQNLSLLFAMALVVALVEVRRGGFVDANIMANIFGNASVVGLVAIAETVVIIAAGLDISVGSLAGLTGVVSGVIVASWGWPTPLGIAGAILVGVLAGLFNGSVITFLKVNPVIATLGSLAGFRGLAFIVAPDNRPIGVLEPSFTSLGTSRILQTGSFRGIPTSALFMLFVALLVGLFLKYTDIGRNIYAIGGNDKAAHLSGVRLTRMRLGIYALSGGVAALSGILVVARTFSAQPVSGTAGLELEAVTAAFLGGCTLSGGKGTITGTVLAVLLLQTLKDGMSFLSIGPWYQDLAKWILLVGAVALGEWRTARSKSAAT